MAGAAAEEAEREEIAGVCMRVIVCACVCG